VSVQQTQASSIRDSVDVRALSEDEQLALKARQDNLDKLLARKQIAKYKIEILFGTQRRINGLTVGVMSFYESGTKLNGGGDEKVYLCPGRRLGKNTCQAPICASHSGFGFRICPVCQSRWTEAETIGELFFKLPMQKWAEATYNLFRDLQFNADIYLKYHPTDIRVTSALEIGKPSQGNLLNKARQDRGKHIYPLRNIIKDSAAGASIDKRFYAFLVA